ncbi:hypothetical protein ACFQXB_14465 [Plastorhodobacter daqingensis]|uniref:Uncharacterized protein n=1 Tax=Plastorhodobacter daqingensis TaxID=1387281 RepID=A0ABW2UL06_9RHOB
MRELQVIERELTLADVTPAVDQLRPMAAENLANAHALTKDRGRLLARSSAASGFSTPMHGQDDIMKKSASSPASLNLGVNVRWL